MLPTSSIFQDCFPPWNSEMSLLENYENCALPLFPVGFPFSLSSRPELGCRSLTSDYLPMYERRLCILERKENSFLPPIGMFPYCDPLFPLPWFKRVLSPFSADSFPSLNGMSLMRIFFPRSPFRISLRGIRDAFFSALLFFGLRRLFLTQAVLTILSFAIGI